MQNKIKNFLWNDLAQRYSTYLGALCVLVNICFQISWFPAWFNKEGLGAVNVFYTGFILGFSGLFAILLLIFIFVERKNNIKIKDNKFINNKFVKSFVLILFLIFILSLPLYFFCIPFSLEVIWDTILDYIYNKPVLNSYTLYQIWSVL